MRPRPLSPHVRPTCAVTLGSPSPNIHHPGGTGRRLASRGAGPMRTVCSLLFTTSSPTSSDTQGELVAEVTTGRLTLTPAGGPDEELTTAAPALGSVLRQARPGALHPGPVPGGRGSSLRRWGDGAPRPAHVHAANPGHPSLCSPRPCSSQRTRSPLFLPLCLPPSSPASAGGAESGSLPTPGSATCEAAGQRGLRGGRPWWKV